MYIDIVKAIDLNKAINDIKEKSYKDKYDKEIVNLEDVLAILNSIPFSFINRKHIPED